jgi:hypothetical protein
MRTKYLLAALLVGSALAGAPALADPDNHGGGGGGGGHPAAAGGHWGGNGGHWSGGHWNGGHWNGGRGSWHRGWNNHWAANHVAFRFSTRDVSHFNSAELSRWRGGHWWHGRHGGRNGWWWGFNGGFYFYDAPIYPYPGYVSDDFYYDDGDYDYGPGPDDYDDDQGPGPDNMAPPNYRGAPNVGSWFYCRKPEGYYPYVRTCHGDWQRVPAQPENYGPGPDDRDGTPGADRAYGPPTDMNRGGPSQNDDEDDDGPDDGPPPPAHH